ncbi:MAG: type II toxin-antitoxin system Phd/YefM family antitoxin [Treponema sp.]|nr:type II toxin-antitoxin system Phd/YefM family antitoxin [Treponema sp.]
MITDVQECIKPISYIKSNAADMMNFVNEKKEPLIITQNGESRAVLIDVESYQEMKNAFSMLKLIQFSQIDVKAGKSKKSGRSFFGLEKHAIIFYGLLHHTGGYRPGKGLYSKCRKT